MATTAAPEQDPRADAKRQQRDAREKMRAELDRMLPSLAPVLRGRDAEQLAKRMLQLTMTAALKQPELYEAHPVSVFQALTRVAQWRLDIGTTAHLLTFRNRQTGIVEVTPVAAYTGLIELVLRTRHVRDIWGETVRKHDRFTEVRGANPDLIHEGNWFEDRGPLVGAYAVAVLAHSRKTWAVMSAKQIAAVRARARGSDKPSSPWKTDEEEMWRKSAIRRLCKRLPQSDEMADALRAGDEVEGSYEVMSAADAPAAVEPVRVRPLITAGQTDVYEIERAVHRREEREPVEADVSYDEPADLAAAEPARRGEG